MMTFQLLWSIVRGSSVINDCGMMIDELKNINRKIVAFASLFISSNTLGVRNPAPERTSCSVDEE